MQLAPAFVSWGSWQQAGARGAAQPRGSVLHIHLVVGTPRAEASQPTPRCCPSPPQPDAW